MRAEAFEIMEDLDSAYWWYVARRRIIADVVSRYVPRGARVLDFGCGAGATTAALIALGYEAVGADRSERALETCRARGVPVVPLDHDWVEDGGLDCVLCCDVLEHVEDDRALLRDLGRTLRPNGVVVITVPAYEFLWSGEDYASEHLRRYTSSRLKTVARSAGLDVIWSSYFNTLLFPVVAAAIFWTRLFRPRAMYRSNVRPLWKPLDKALTAVFSLEGRVLGPTSLPFGTSVIAVATRAAADREKGGRS